MLIGRLTAKPELRYTSSNIPFARFTVAVNRNFSNGNGEREADFINTIAWRKQAENICNYIDKGSLVSIEGRIQTGSYDDKDGNRRYTTDVVADSVEFLEPKSQRQNMAANSNNDNISPYDYQEDSNYQSSPSVNIENDPFADFGDSVSIDDNFLD
jgi:single-strand DNA-binding protein